MPSSSPDDTVRLFLSYAREDFDAVSALYDRLEALGLHPWMDKYDILPGERWETKLSQAIRESHFFLACLSAKSVEKRGYLQREFKQALDLWQEKLDSDIYLIPVRLDECQVPETLRAFQWANLYEEDAWWALLRAIRAGAERQGLTPPQELRDLPRRGRPVQKTGASPAAQPQRPDLLIIDKPLRLEMVRVPAGEFLMGSDPAKDKGAFDAERPQHRLSLPEFYIGKYPVTNEQYAVFVQQTKIAAPGHWKMGKIPSGKEKHPVVNVPWHDATAFCEWVSKTTGGEYRLASEAEWEKAARGVDGRLYPWGKQAPTAELCNFNRNIGEATPVGRYPKGASPYGALDMAGNVWEWTLSLWGKDAGKPQFGYPYKSTDGREDLQATVDIKRVVRGGSCRDVFDGFVRCAYRDGFSPNDRYDFVGFRVVCVSPPHHASGL